MPATGNPEQVEKEEEDTIFEKRNGKYFCSMSGYFTCCHHEVHRTKLYVLDEPTFPIPLQFVKSSAKQEQAPMTPPSTR